jgi:tetratricopeptide (TPR) repeat protein
LRATIAWQAGTTACTASGLDDNIDCLRERARRRTPALIPHALADALEISGEASLESSNWTRALTLFEEARTALAFEPETRRDVVVRSMIWAATARSWIEGGLPAAARELEKAYALACAQSLPREASLALGRLCQLFDLVGNVKRAAELATTYLEPIAAELVGDWRASAHLDIANVCVSIGRLAKAREQLRCAKAAAPPGSFAYAAGVMGDAEVAVAMRDAPAAIAHADAALAEMERLGRHRHVGAVLAVRAEALWLSGRRPEASAQMHDALHLMGRFAHPLRLATQYRRAVRITNDRAHARAARELWSAHAVRL